MDGGIVRVKMRMVKSRARNSLQRVAGTPKRWDGPVSSQRLRGELNEVELQRGFDAVPEAFSVSARHSCALEIGGSRTDLPYD